MNNYNDVNVELDLLWAFLGTDKDGYLANCAIIDATTYPNYNKLVALGKSAVEDLNTSWPDANKVSTVLLLLSVDNETEDILSFLEELLNDDSALNELINQGISYPSFHTRWQIAELIGRKKECKFTPLLLKLLADENPYVQRRALLAMANVDTACAVSKSLEFLSSDDDYLRLVAVRTIKQLAPEMMQEVRGRLKNDSFKYVRHELQ